GDKVTEDDKAPVKEAIEKLKTTVAGGDTEAIKADTEALEKAFYGLSEKLYAQQGGAQGAGPDMGANGGQAGGEGFYNADFEDKTDK
ncbi:MAG: molecular chaperone DnaK, partial [Clostridia bacterium]|nr:molecular chaperone DnaK [Clostridia bacterium]